MVIFRQHAASIYGFVRLVRFVCSFCLFVSFVRFVCSFRSFVRFVRFVRIVCVSEKIIFPACCLVRFAAFLKCDPPFMSLCERGHNDKG